MPQAQGPVVVVVQSALPYQVALAQGVCDVLEPLGVPAVIHVWADAVPAPPPSLVRLLQEGDPRGVIAVAFGVGALAGGLHEMLGRFRHLPTVHIGRPALHPGSGSVLADNATGMRLVAEHLVVGCGARRVLVVRGWPQHRDSLEREHALIRELDRLGAPVPASRVVTGDFLREGSYRAVRDALVDHPDVDAVAAFNDQSALGALDALGESGRAVPGDVVVCGFDGESASAEHRPSVTTVDQGLRGQGALAARMLVRMIDGGPAESLRAPVRLVVRESTRAPGGPAAAGADRDPGRRRAADRIAELDTALALSRAVMLCTSVPRLVEQLAVSGSRLESRRLVLVLGPALAPVDADATAAVPGAPEVPGAPPERLGTVAFAQQDGTVLEAAHGTRFDLRHLLPEGLPGPRTTPVTVFPLWTGEVELGYVVSDRFRSGRTALNDVLRLDLHHCLAAVHTRLTLYAHAEELERQVALRTAQLEEANENLRVAAQRDGLTGLYNRSAFQDALATEWERHARSGRPLSLLMIDADLFKPYNDRYGHVRGDEALRLVSRCLEGALPPEEPSGESGGATGHGTACRYGGEEFAVVLPDTTPAGAVEVAQRIRLLLALVGLEHLDSPSGRLTVSIGTCTTVPGAGDEPGELVTSADEALYAVKRGGRDGIRTAVAASSPGSPAPLPALPALPE